VVDAKKTQILIRTWSSLPKARVSTAQMRSLRVKFRGSVTLEGLLDVPQPNPETGAGVPMITVRGSYHV
jgi:hypothetical protein